MAAKKSKAKKTTKPKTISATVLKNWNCEIAGKVFTLTEGKKVSLPHEAFETLKNAGVVK